MAQIVKVDGYDIASIVDVSNDRLDPADADFLQPQFGETALGDGSAFVSDLVANKTLGFPVQVTPSKLGFADTVDGLHACVADLNRRLAAASHLEWRDEGATSSTVFDVEKAILRIDQYRYNRARAKWLSGTIEFTVRPYGHTGTSRIVGTAAGTGPLLTVPIPSVAGDVPARLDGTTLVTGNIGTTVLADFETHLISVVPTTYDPRMPIASVRTVGATLMNDTGTPGGVVARAFVGGSAQGFADIFCSASVGDVRVFGAVRLSPPPGASAGSVATVAFSAVQGGGRNNPTIVVVREGNATGGWQLVDFGIVRPDPALSDSTFLGVSVGAPTGLASTAVDLGDLIAVPEDSSTLLLDQMYVGQSFASLPYAAATGGYWIRDQTRVPNQRAHTPGLAPTSGNKLIYYALPNHGGQGSGVADTTAGVRGAGLLDRRLDVTVRCVERFTFAR